MKNNMKEFDKAELEMVTGGKDDSIPVIEIPMVQEPIIEEISDEPVPEKKIVIRRPLTTRRRTTITDRHRRIEARRYPQLIHLQ
ncbi:MAG: hypothetical protein IKE53_02850 [Clostridiales bacterium]|nr:hypothetical protein [Clostridiales bacterium]